MFIVFEKEDLDVGFIKGFLINLKFKIIFIKFILLIYIYKWNK